jgi:hypothetical protein
MTNRPERIGKGIIASATRFPLEAGKICHRFAEPSIRKTRELVAVERIAKEGFLGRLLPRIGAIKKTPLSRAEPLIRLKADT